MKLQREVIEALRLIRESIINGRYESAVVFLDDLIHVLKERTSMKPQEFDNSYNDGQVKGDTKSMPDKGTSTGLTDTYGASVDQESTNTEGKITGATKSDSPFDNMPDNPNKPDEDD